MLPKQKMNRRQFMQISAATGITTLLAACTPATAPAGTTEQAAPSVETVKLQYQSREPENAAGVAQLWSEWYLTFQETHPNIEVEFLPWPGGVEREGPYAAMVAGTAPDILEFCCSNTTFFMQQGETLNLQPFIERDAEEVNLDDYYAHQFDPCKMDGDIHFLPRFTGTMCIYYNKDWFDQAGVPYPPSEWGGWSYEDYAAIGPTFVGQEPQTWATSNYGLSGNWLTQYWLRGFGANMVDPNDNTRCGLDTPEARECLEFLRSMIWDLEMFVPSNSTMSGGINVTTLFTSERIAMMEMGPWELNNVIDTAQFRWDVAPMIDGPAGHTTHQSVDGSMIWRRSSHPEEAWELLKGLTSPEFGILLAKYANKQPSRKSILDQFPVLLREFNEAYSEISLEVFIDSLAQDIGGPEEMFANDAVSKEQILTPAFEKVMLLGEAPVDYIVAHTDIATRFNRGEIPIEQLGAELDSIRS
jgi:multiple sugar transport system substrate-binding protein